MNLSELAAKHDYYCHDSNYYSNDAHEKYSTWQDFFAEFGDADIDMNLVFRFDIKLKNDETPQDGYYMELFIMQQRKGRFVPVDIKTVTDKDAPHIVSFLQKHHEKIKQIWQPFL